MKKLGWPGWMLLLIWVFSGISFAEAGEPVTMEIPETITVAGPKIYLSNLGTVTGGTVQERQYLERVDLGQAPGPGQVRIFTREYLGFIIKQYRFNQPLILKMGKQVEVRVEADCIKGEEIQKAIEEKLPVIKPDYLRRTLELHNLPKEVWLRKGEWQIEAAPLGNLPELGTVLFKVVLSRDQEKRTINLSGKLRVYARVHRAIKPIPLHREILKDNFELVETELTNGKEFLGEIPERTRTTKPLKQGEILREDQLQPIPLVFKDREVNVIVKNNNIEITIVGIAKADGWMGDRIPVLNPTSRKIFQGRVTGSNVVEVNVQ